MGKSAVNFQINTKNQLRILKCAHFINLFQHIQPFKSEIMVLGHGLIVYLSNHVGYFIESFTALLLAETDPRDLLIPGTPTIAMYLYCLQEALTEHVDSHRS